MGAVDRADEGPPSELDVVKLRRELRAKDERDEALEYADCRDVTLPAGSLRNGARDYRAARQTYRIPSRVL